MHAAHGHAPTKNTNSPPPPLMRASFLIAALKPLYIRTQTCKSYSAVCILRWEVSSLTSHSNIDPPARVTDVI